MTPDTTSQVQVLDLNGRASPVKSAQVRFLEDPDHVHFTGFLETSDFRLKQLLNFNDCLQ